MKNPSSFSGRFSFVRPLLGTAVFIAAGSFAQENTAAGGGSSSDPEKRAQWLNARPSVKTVSKPQPSPKQPAPTASPKIAFRSSVPKLAPRDEVEVTPPKSAGATMAKTAAQIPSAPDKPSASSKTGGMDGRGTAETTTFAKLATPAPARSTAERAASAPKTVPVKASTSAPSAAPTRSETTRTSSKSKLTLEPAVTAISSSRSTGSQSAARTATIESPSQTPTYFQGSGFQGSGGRRYPWKTNIITTIFWVGEAPSGNNFTPNYSSSWDKNWSSNYGGYDNPDPSARRGYLPARFVPRLNPFYVALPYNDVTRGTTKPESRRVIPWFKEAFQREGQSVCRDRWVAVRNRSGRIGYAQWSDCGPFRTDHWQYVFGNERPKPNLNKGAGLDVSPALRDYLGLSGTDVTDWKFVDFSEVPPGPWSLHGQNNTFVQRGGRWKGGSRVERTADNSPRTRVSGL